MQRIQPILTGPARLELRLTVTDPEVVAELRKLDEGESRDRHALAALRLGVLAIRHASGQLDAGAIRDAGSHLVGEVRELLSQRTTELATKLGGELDRHLDPQKGALPQRLESLTKKDGELDRALSRTLAEHFGKNSDLLRLLSPEDANGLRKQLEATLQSFLGKQREQVLKEFSLDVQDSALNRLSALLQRSVDDFAKKNADLHGELRSALASLQTRREEAKRSPRHGATFEEKLGELLGIAASRGGDVCESVGAVPGAAGRSKVGDFVLVLGRDSRAAGTRIVVEAKAEKGFRLADALRELETARANRQAQIGVFVFAKDSAPPGSEPFARHGQDLVVVWDADDPATDLAVQCAVSVARALAVRLADSGSKAKEALADFELAARAVEKQVQRLAELETWAVTVRNNGEKMVLRAGQMRAELERQVELLDRGIAALRAGAGETSGAGDEGDAGAGAGGDRD